MFSRLEILKKKGYIPDTIIDIGACYGDWTKECKRIYPEATYYLVEPIPYPVLDSLKNLPDIFVFHVLLDETERTVDWYERQNTGDSMFREKTFHYQDCVPIKKQTTTLSNIIEKYIPFMEHVLLKIDCQGAEIPILKGAGKILEKIDFIVVEIPLFGQYNEQTPSFLEHVRYMEEIGFVPFDILEVHMIQGFSLQIDMLFISKRHPFHQKVQEILLIPY